MSVLILGFALGVWYCQYQAILPSAGAWTTILLGALALAMVLRRRSHRFVSLSLLVFASCCAGISYAAWRAESRLADALALELEGHDISVVGVISDLPQHNETGVRFSLSVVDASASVPSSLLVSWYAPRSGSPTAFPSFRAGQKWRFVLRLRRPHGSLNPHGFDYEAVLFERGVRAVGYVRSGSERLLSAVEPGAFYAVQRIRERIRDRFERALPHGEWRGVLIALAIGDQASVSAEQWRLFGKTGVTHLMSISGLHVTGIAALIAWLVNAMWRREPRLCLRLPAQKAAILAGLCAATLYVALAGFGIPAQRTLYMLACVAAAMWLGRSNQALSALSLALLVVLLIDPWAVLSAGFWLSFGAVSALMLALAHQTNKPNIAMAWLRAQWAILVMSVPLLLGLLHQFSLISPLANLLAIPLVSFVVTPLALLFALLPLPVFAELAHRCIALLMAALSWGAALPWAVWHQAAPPFWLVVLAVIAGLWALLPRGLPARWTGLLVCVPLLAWSPPRPASGEFRLTAIDVGQGLAVHIQTASRDFLFDAGPRYSEDSDSGERVIVPYLRAQGVRRLHGMAVSHDDNDHSGGAESVLRVMPVDWLLASLPAEHILLQQTRRSLACHAIQQWEWDGVRFEILHPQRDAPLERDNDQSCVLRVSGMKFRALIPGDIELRAEALLLARHAEHLRADVLIAPHHGSRTSSSTDFVRAVRARYVIFTTGYRNRFRHPHPAVVDRYRAHDATLLRSDSDGAVTIVSSEGGILAKTERTERARYWHGR